MFLGVAYELNFLIHSKRSLILMWNGSLHDLKTSVLSLRRPYSLMEIIGHLLICSFICMWHIDKKIMLSKRRPYIDNIGDIYDRLIGQVVSMSGYWS